MAANFLVDIRDTKHQLRWLMNQDLVFNPQNFIKATPHVPGVYRMLSDQHKVIYVGKAKNLPKRIITYFKGTSHRIDLESQIASMQTVFVFQDQEAMELEYNIYLKYYLPYYNKTSPENSSYLYLTNVADGYQTINAQPVWQRDLHHMDKSVEFIGPFTATRKHWEILNEFQTVFKIPSCSPHKFRQHRKDGFVCEEGQFDRCKGHCIHTSRIDYQNYWQPIREIFLHKGAAGKELFRQVAPRMPVTKEWIGHRSILDTLNLLDNFDLLYLHREEQLAAISVIEVCKGQVIDIRNLLLADGEKSANLSLLATKLTQVSNQELLSQFLLPYYQLVRSRAYLADNEMIKHFPRKVIVLNSDFTASLAKEYSMALTQIFGYKVTLGARCPYTSLIALAKFNAMNACLQRRGLLGENIDTKVEIERKYRQKLPVNNVRSAK